MRSVSVGSTLRFNEEEKSEEVTVEQFRKSRRITNPRTLEARLEEHFNARLESPFQCQVHVRSIDPLNYAVRTFHHVPETSKMINGKLVTTQHERPDKNQWVRELNA